MVIGMVDDIEALERVVIMAAISSGFFLFSQVSEFVFVFATFAVNPIVELLVRERFAKVNQEDVSAYQQ